MAKIAAKKSRAKRVNAPKVPKQEPQQDLFVVMQRSGSGIRVDQETANQFSAVYACVGVIAETLAAMPWNVIKRSGGKREVASEHVVDWLLHNQPNPEMTAFTFKELLISWALTWGNGYAEIERDRAGRVLWLWPICPDRVRVGRDERGEVVYEVRNRWKEPTYLYAEDMFHLKGRGFDGLVGYSVVELAARSIGYAFDLEAEGSSLAANDSTPGGVLRHKGRLSEPAKVNLRKGIEKIHGGPKNKGRLMILEEDMQYQAIGLPHKDTQFLENRKFQVTEICRWFRVPPHKIADLDRATFSNIEHQGTEFVTDCLMPWACRMEQEANWKMFGRQQRGVYSTKVNLNGLMRGDSTARSAFYNTMRTLGVYSADDILALEDMNPIGTAGGGEKRLVQINQTTLDKVGEEPIESVQQPVESVQVQDETENEATEPAPVDAMNAWFTEASRQIASREHHRATDAAKRFAGKSSEFEAWLVAFFAEHQEYAVRTLSAPAKALAGESSEVQASLQMCVARHLTARRNDLLATFDSGAIQAAEPAALAKAARASVELGAKLTATLTELGT